MLRACLTELKLDGVRITDVDLAHGRKEGGTGTTKASGRPDKAGIGGFDIFRRQITPIVELHAPAQEKRVGFAVFGNLPTMRQVRNDALPAVAWITPDQIVIHTALCADIGDSAGLMHIEVSWRTQDPVAQDPTAFGIGLRRPELPLRPVKHIGDFSG